MLERKKIELEFVTPAFLSGADQRVAEWRESSIRGQLRWWFRAIAGGDFAGDLDRTREAESRVFGTTERASPMRLRASRPGPASVTPGKECFFGKRLTEVDIARLWASPGKETEARLKVAGAANPIHYLGYGPIARDKVLKKVLFERAYVDAGSSPVSFYVQADSRDFLSDEFSIFKRALWGWLNLGGIGARSRRGFGSILPIETSGLATIAATLEEFATTLESLIPPRTTEAAAASLPEWSHLSPQTAVYVSKRRDKWQDALQDAGAWMIGFRRRYGAAIDERPSKKSRDYDWFAPNGSETHGTPKHGTAGHVPDRAGFGLPLPFGKHDVLNWTDHDETGGRRASPLLLRISKFGSDYHSVWTHMPARLIPEGEKLRCSPGKEWLPTPEQDRVVGEFLADLVAKTLLKEVGR